MLTIKQRQQNLKTYYYFYTGNIDGVEGDKTKNAYKSFQKFTNLTVDGIYGNNTNNKLIEVIKDLQGKLNLKGYNLKVDGMVGNNTINAIKDFQNKNNLIVDGIAGLNTYKKLNETINVSTKYRYPVNFIAITQYCSSKHMAIDLGWSSSFGGKNQNIYACYDGTVITNSFSSDTGNYVAIKHDNGDISRYLHLNEKPNLYIGQRVQKGEKIGIMGSTGKSTGNHLHFDLTRDGSRINPIDYLYVYSDQNVYINSKNNVRYI
jgi:hypothetical protein